MSTESGLTKPTAIGWGSMNGWFGVGMTIRSVFLMISSNRALTSASEG